LINNGAYAQRTLKPEKPIVDLDVLNPEITMKYFKQRGCILDILVRLNDGTRVDIEMQMERAGALRQRALYHWSRTYSGGLKKSKSFGDLNPTAVIFFLNAHEFPSMPNRAHHRFFVTHDLDPTLKIYGFRLDFVELPKIPLASLEDFTDKTLQRWCQFFRNPNQPELQEIFMMDKNIKKAKERLTALSADPSIQELARMRQSAAHNWKNSLKEAKEEGRRELISKLLQSDIGAVKSTHELATLLGCSEEEVLAVKKSLTP
jgi:predicted transposase/invertase (TIGR01784 family)